MADGATIATFSASVGADVSVPVVAVPLVSVPVVCVPVVCVPVVCVPVVVPVVAGSSLPQATPTSATTASTAVSTVHLIHSHLASPFRDPCLGCSGFPICVPYERFGRAHPPRS